eukprot:11343193-Karenia_brevis.AAC.1
MAKIKHAQELAERIANRKHMIQQAGAPLAQERISMSSAVAVSDGPSPYYAPGIALPYDGLSTQEAPQGLSIRGIKRTLEYSEVPDSPTRSKAKMMVTKIFASHPVMQDTLQTADSSTKGHH